VETKAKTEPGGARDSGLWRPTSLGIAFAHGDIRVPTHVEIFANEVRAVAEERFDVHGALAGGSFDYDELIGRKP
jgi:hypothetical protein